jgi:hypothetical protein
MEYVLDVRHIYTSASGELSSLTARRQCKCVAKHAHTKLYSAHSSTESDGEAGREEPKPGLHSRRKWR